MHVFIPAGISNDVDQNVLITLRSDSTGQPTTKTYSEVTITIVPDDDADTPVSITPVDGTLGSFVSSGWKVTSLTGEHQFSIPNTHVATAGKRFKIVVSASGVITATTRVVVYDPAKGLGDPSNIDATIGSRGTADPGDEMALIDNAVAAAKVAVSALNGKGDWNVGKTGYSLAAGGMDSVILPADLITASALAASAVTELRTAINGGDWPLDTDLNGTLQLPAATQASIDNIEADTDELQGDLVNGGRLDLIFDQILADTNELQTDDVPGLIAALNDLAAADVLTQVNSALTAVVADSVPAAGTRPSVAQACYMFAQYIRNRAISESSQIIYKPGATNVTPLFTLTMDDASDPTSYYQSA